MSIVLLSFVMIEDRRRGLIARTLTLVLESTLSGARDPHARLD
jgi:hypothetical protein